MSALATVPERSSRRLRRPQRTTWIRWLSPLVLLALWQLASSTGVLPERTLASPIELSKTAWDAREIVAGEPYERGLGFEIASSKSLEDPAKVAAIRDYVRRLSAAWEWAGENPDEWAAAWTEDTRLPLAVTRLAARRKASDIIPLDASIVASQQRLADLFADEGELPGKIEFSDIVDTLVLGESGSGR